MDPDESQSSSTNSSQEMCKILFHKELVFCLVCQCDIEHATDASQHILEHSHKENMKNLFKICIKDPFCNSTDPRYADVVNSSVLDISHVATTNDVVSNSLLAMSHILTSETSCDKSFECLLCKKTVSRAFDHDEVKIDLVFHLKVEHDSHLDYMKRNFSWVYPEKNTNTFIMFRKSIVYCSLCDEVLDYVDNHMLQAAVWHLKTSEHLTKLEPMALSNNVTCNPESIDGLDQELMSLKVTGNAMLHLKNNLFGIGNNLLLCSNVTEKPESIETGDSELICGLDQELKSGVAENAMLHLEDSLSDVSGHNLLSSSNATDKPESNATSDSESIDGLDCLSDASSDDSEESDCEDLVDQLKEDPLTCPDCGETIEIYNNNADFSLRHHSQKHIDLSVVNENVDCEYQQDTDYVCPVCSKTIPIFNKNLELSIARHFDENNHDQGFCTSEIYNESEFLDNVLTKLSQKHHIHRAFFKLDGNQIFCKLCSSVLQESSNDVSYACELITKHILDRYHSDQYKISSQQLKLTVVSYNKEIVTGPQSLLLQNSLLETLANNNVHIRNNKDFIEVQNYLYLCKICQKYISYSPNESTLKKNFLLHFNLLIHKKGLKKTRKGLRLQSTANALGSEKQLDRLTASLRNKAMFQKVLSKMAKDSNLSDVKYIEYKSGKFICHICNVSMSASTCGLPAKDHILGLKHSKQKKLDKVKNEMIQLILNQKMKFSSYLRGNLDNIDTVNGNFFCNLCKVPIIANAKLSQLKEHLASKSHKSKFYRDAHLRSCKR